ncbi:hypothetical protein PLEOSDRAFT_1108009 [Pleurotus ostreatus PC15]|uniref:DUF5648 domain-containing protein n=1 Tax=Pleurotus ostreatus (strain PC15) TaxID=1137138 RepID=A0A067NB72_PLEO1|nr:hypothetical protein PLEOSDRAFT_1108009 [Pleurotus ostreatus PC15]
MKISAGLFASALCVVQVACAPAEDNIATIVDNSDKIPVPCPDERRSVRLLRGYSPSASDNFYTTDANEMANAINNFGYIDQGYAARIYPNQERYTSPIYRLWNSHIGDHFYTTNRDEVDDYIRRHYTYENTPGFIFSTQICKSIPMYRLHNVQQTDHFYTTSAKDRFYYVQNLGYQYEGIIGYVLPV